MARKPTTESGHKARNDKDPRIAPRVLANSVIDT